MIQRRGTHCPSAIAFLSGLLLLVAVAPSPAVAEDQKYASQRIDLGNARRVTRKPVKRQSMVARAARGQAIAEVPPKPLDGSLIRGPVRNVGFLDDYQGSTYGYEPGCGCGEAICDCGEVACGIEPGCGLELGCGLEPGCGFEPGCGLEPGCGIGVGCDCGLGGACGCEAACGVEYLVGPGCGIEGCAGCDACGFEPACGLEGTGDCGCDACCSPGLPVFLPFLRLDWRRFEFFVGTQGFKGPANFASINAADPTQRVGSGSFGFYQGFNEGRSLNRLLGADLATQFGVRATQSNLSGADFTSKTRHQVFVTCGLFRRVDFGLQFGLVFDYLSDDWYYQADLSQIRGEFSWNTGRRLTYGFQYMVATDSDTLTTTAQDLNNNIVQTTQRFESTEQYRFFLRRKLKGRSSYSGFAGWTRNDDGLIGSLVDITLNQNYSLNCGATYLIPTEGTGSGGNQQESWNIALGFTFRPGPVTCGRYCRPMFDVADNGTFMVDRL